MVRELCAKGTDLNHINVYGECVGKMILEWKSPMSGKFRLVLQIIFDYGYSPFNLNIKDFLIVKDHLRVLHETSCIFKVLANRAKTQSKLKLLPDQIAKYIMDY